MGVTIKIISKMELNTRATYSRPQTQDQNTRPKPSTKKRTHNQDSTIKLRRIFLSADNKSAQLNLEKSDTFNRPKKAVQQNLFFALGTVLASFLQIGEKYG